MFMSFPDSSGIAKELVSGDVQYIDLATQVGKEEVVSTADQAGTGSVSVQLTNATDFSNLTSLNQEVLGELDPQTGIFYASSHDTMIPTRQAGQVSMVQLGSSTHTVFANKEQILHKPVDFLSSALTQAQIDLDPYQFVEEDEATQAVRLAAATASRQATGVTMDSTPSSTSLVSLLNPAACAATYPTPDSSQDTESQSLSQDSESVIVEGEQIDNIVVLDQVETEIATDTNNQMVAKESVPSVQTPINVYKARTVTQPRMKTITEPRKVVVTREPQIKTITLDQSGKTVMLETPRTVAVEQSGRQMVVGESPAPTGQPRIVTVEELRRMVRSHPATTANIKTVQKVTATTVSCLFYSI